MRGTDNSVWFNTGGPFNWGNWAPLGGAIVDSPAAAVNQDGRIAVFVEGTDTAVWTIEQSSPGSWQ